MQIVLTLGQRELLIPLQLLYVGSLFMRQRPLGLTSRLCFHSFPLSHAHISFSLPPSSLSVSRSLFLSLGLRPEVLRRGGERQVKRVKMLICPRRGGWQIYFIMNAGKAKSNGTSVLVELGVDVHGKRWRQRIKWGWLLLFTNFKEPCCCRLNFNIHTEM